MPERFVDQPIETVGLAPVDQTPDTKRRNGITLKKFLPHAFRIGAIGSILLTAAACGSKDLSGIGKRAQKEEPRTTWAQLTQVQRDEALLFKEKCPQLTQETYKTCLENAGDQRLPRSILYTRSKILLARANAPDVTSNQTSPNNQKPDYTNGIREVKKELKIPNPFKHFANDGGVAGLPEDLADWIHTEEWRRDQEGVAIAISTPFALVGILALFAKYVTRKQGPYPDIGDRRAWEEAQRRKRSASREHSSGGYSSSYSSSPAPETPQSDPKHPFFSTKSIQPHPLEGTWFEGPKTLRGDSGVVGHLRNDATFDRQQIMSDRSGRDVGRIKPDALFEDKQIIEDDRGKRVGNIETNWRGERVIKDSDGKEVGKLEKTWWGDTEIKWK